MTRDQIYSKLKALYPQESSTILKEASYNLTFASVEASTLEQKAKAAIERLKSQAMLRKPLAEAAQKTTAEAFSYCPICKEKMETGKLLEDREVIYCKDHRIVVPLPRAEEDV